MGGHKGFDLCVLLLLQQLLHHLDVTVLGVSHQDQVSCQALLHGTLGILADSLEVRANLDRKLKATCGSVYLQVIYTSRKLRYSIVSLWKGGGTTVTSSVTVMRLKAWMAASCTDRVVAGCLMHFTRVVLIAGSTASIASPMLPTTWM